MSQEGNQPIARRWFKLLPVFILAFVIADCSEQHTAAGFGTLTGNAQKVLCVAFRGRAETLATVGADATIKLWDMRTKMERTTLRGHRNWSGLRRYLALSLAFSPDGETLATGGDDGTVRLWDAESGKELLTLAGYGLSGSLWGGWEVFSLAYSPDARTLASGSRDGTLKLWDLAKWKEWLALKERLGWLGRLRCQQRLFSSLPEKSPDCLALRRLGAPPLGRELDLRLATLGYNGWVTALNFSPDGRILAIGTARPAWPDHGLAQILHGRDRAVEAGYLDSTRVARGEVRLWDLASRTQLGTITDLKAVLSLAFSPDGEILAIGNGSTLTLWRVGESQVAASLSTETSAVRSVAFSPDGKILAAAGHEIAFLWDVPKFRKLAGLVGSPYPVAFSPDGRILVTGSSDSGTVRLWQLATAVN